MHFQMLGPCFHQRNSMVRRMYSCSISWESGDPKETVKEVSRFVEILISSGRSSTESRVECVISTAVSNTLRSLRGTFPGHRYSSEGAQAFPGSMLSILPLIIVVLLAVRK